MTCKESFGKQSSEALTWELFGLEIVRTNQSVARGVKYTGQFRHDRMDGELLSFSRTGVRRGCAGAPRSTRGCPGLHRGVGGSCRGADRSVWGTADLACGGPVVYRCVHGVHYESTRLNCSQKRIWCKISSSPNSRLSRVRLACCPARKIALG